ncbi:MAG: hypothetical protein P4L84_23175, partial [Isosphaeraceae bacterium]|nr:hypothetical protein [Isosphaeraceae bacterium]
MNQWRSLSTAFVCVSLACMSAGAAELSKGTPDWKSAGPMAFGPDGLLFLADTQGAAVFAVDTGDRRPDTASKALKVDAINEKLAALLGTSTDRIAINELAVNPASGRVYLTVSRGTGPAAKPVLVRVDRSGQLEIVSLENVPFSRATLPNPTTGSAPRSSRSEAITDLAF